MTDVVKGLIEAAHLDEATRVSRIIDEKFGDRAKALSYIANALHTAGRSNAAAEFIEQTISAARQAEGLSGEALMNVTELLAQAGQLERAIERADSVEDLFRGRAQGACVAQLIRAGDLERAITVAGSMKRAWGWWWATALVDVAEALARARPWDRALEVARTIDHALTRNGQADEALALADQLNSTFHQAHALRRIAKGLHDAKQEEEAWALIKHSQSKVFEIEDADQLRGAFMALVTTVARMGEKDLALRLARYFQNQQMRVKLWTDMAAAFIDAEMRSEAMLVVNEALDLVRMIEMSKSDRS